MMDRHLFCRVMFYTLCREYKIKPRDVCLFSEKTNGGNLFIVDYKGHSDQINECCGWSAKVESIRRHTKD